MKCVENLLKAEGNKMKIGNHSMERRGSIRGFVYFKTEICTVNDDARTFSTTTGGWYTRSTLKAIKSYREMLLSQGYREE
jgi:hypothetical protein